jgi:hypothetical protein
MAVRTAYVGTQVAGDVLTAANFTKMPGGCIGYLQKMTDQNGITTEVDLVGLTGLTVTVGASRLIKTTATMLIEPRMGNGSTPMYADLRCYDGATQLWQMLMTADPLNSWLRTHTLSGSFLHSLSAGSHTLKLTLQSWSGTGTGWDVSLRADPTRPATLIVEDVGPSF